MLSSKQRPRKLQISGSDGNEYPFLLKGHEDLRQDERVMQLFGLVNTLLARDPETFKRHLSIQKYPAIPLSPNSGLLGWVCPWYKSLKQPLMNVDSSATLILCIYSSRITARIGVSCSTLRSGS